VLLGTMLTYFPSLGAELWWGACQMGRLDSFIGRTKWSLRIPIGCVRHGDALTANFHVMLGPMKPTNQRYNGESRLTRHPFHHCLVGFTSPNSKCKLALIVYLFDPYTMKDARFWFQWSKSSKIVLDEMTSHQFLVSCNAAHTVQIQNWLTIFKAKTHSQK